MSEEVAKRVRYFGRVQGVGFRRRTEVLARTLPVKGYVQNLADGSVELVAQGEGEQVDLLLRRVADTMRAEIERQTEEPVVPGRFTDFRIRR